MRIWLHLRIWLWHWTNRWIRISRLMFWSTIILFPLITMGSATFMTSVAICLLWSIM
ncbi:hypothetical protein C2W64_04501 [Brevibacillus laterosporus]|nr:hypothetical protein C2W64_04501 [Brevibacillus laterosporus]